VCARDNIQSMYWSSLTSRSVIYLCEEEYPPANLDFIRKNGIQLLNFAATGNKEPFNHMSPEIVRNAVEAALNPENQPLLIHCNQGKHRTGCVIGCVPAETN